MHYIRNIVLLSLMLLTSLCTWARSVKFYDTELLSSNQVTDICQDSMGYIWIGTEYGLNKFDGAHVEQYYSDDADPHSLCDDIVRCVMTASDGRVWVVTNRGVQHYNRMTDAFETVMFAGSNTANISDILETPDGKIWLLSAHSGVYEVQGGSLDAVPLTTVNRHLRKNTADNMYLDRKGRLWVAYSDAPLQMIDTKSGKTHLYSQALFADNRAVDVTEDARHRLLVLTYNSIMQVDEKTLACKPVVTFPRNAVKRMFKDAKGRLLVGTIGSGLWAVDEGQSSPNPSIKGWKVTVLYPQVTNDFDLAQAHVNAFLEDRGGNRWIGCFRRGVLFVNDKPTSFHYLGLDQMEHDNSYLLRSVFADSQHGLYVCQEKRGIKDIDLNGHVKNLWMNGYTVTTLYEMSANTFLVGTYRDGLFRLDRQTGKAEQLPIAKNQRISSIARDRQGNIYSAVFSEGLRSYTPDGKTERVLGKGRLDLHNPYLNVLFTDASGLIWIGHYYGIDVYNPQTDRLVDVHIPAALRPAIVYAIVQSPKDQSIWIGTNKGLFVYRGARESDVWERYTQKDALPNDIVCGLVATADGSLWISTYRGLAQREPNGTFIRYYRGNGLQDWSFVRSAYTCTTDGDIIFGNQKGITYFSPDKLVKNQFLHGITLTGMWLGNTDVNVSTRSNGKSIITKMLETTDDITVSYLDNTFSLQFSSMEFREAMNIHYEYRFEDEGKDVWHQTAAGVSEIFFTHLGVGTHRLQVRAYDNGAYSPIKTLRIHVTPPWYRSWGAYAFYLMLILAIAALWWRYYWNKRQAETNEEKIKFFVDISHELRSPLTLIKSPLDKMLKESHDQQTTRALRNMERNTNRLLALVNQILSIRKIEKGQMRLHYAETPFADFVSDICHDFDYQVENRQIALNMHNEAEDMAVWIDCDNFDKVVTNLLSNAIKYIDNGGQIDVTVRQIDNKLAELAVRDNGPGIDEAQLKKIFERFYQASARPVAGQMSYGIGLNLSQKIVMLHKGIIIARNRDDGNGSEFVVKLPVQSGAALTPDPAHGEGGDAANASNVPPVSLRSGAGGAAASGAAASGDASPRRRRKTTYHIAVVDDDAELCEFLQTELGETYHVHTYADGRQALEGIAELLPDLVVTDVVMPQMDGIELMKRLKSSTKTSHIPIILLTTKTEHQARISGLEQGADAYIDKPFNLEELEARIAGLIANRIRLRGKFSGIQEQEDTVRKVELKGNDAALMEKIMKAVNERLDDSDFNVEALAATVGLSRVQLHRRMKEMTGITVGEFIRNLRLQQAAKLLEKGDTTVSQVTYAVGFATPTHFTAAFKKHFGVTPSDYMAKAQARRKQ